ncbi:hypothetical protein F5Y03DRAFT_343708 [Xylaria venustula]|nr:hypothetical protein F5Y03DRAFT_343708 [Xylaria venustula]
MSGNQRNCAVLGDARNRANISLVQPVVGQKQSASGPSPTMSRSAATGPGATSSVPKPVASKGKKRKSESTLDEDIAAYKQNLSHVISTDAFEDDPMPSCNAVRGRIRKLLDSSIMNKTEFANAIGANANTLNRFLQASGPMGGSGSSVYYNAWAWFKQREFAKLKMPDVKKRQKLAAADAAASGTGPTTSTAAGSSTNSKKTSSTTAAVAAALPDLSGIYLPGEETDDVPVYDTCDEIRRKISAHLKATPGLTQTQFCRDLYAQLKAPRCKSIQSKQLADFRAMKGPRTGAKSSVFYAAYVYFEKLRIAQNKPKTAHREGMEDVWAAEGGFDREVDHRTSFIGRAGDTFYFDQYGLARMGYGY